MLKNIVQIKEVINEKDYTFLCDNDSPTVDIKEFCYRLMKFCGQIEDQAQAQRDAQQEAEKETPVEDKIEPIEG